MDFQLSERAEAARAEMWEFLNDEIIPAEPIWAEYLRLNGEHRHPPVMEDLKSSARRRGLWNLFLPELGGLSNVEFAPVAEISGWSPVIAPEALNSQAPDTGNMEILARFGNDEQKERWLGPLVDGLIRSSFAMTEPNVASSDANNIEMSIVSDGRDFVINGEKWWITGAADDRCQLLVVLGVTDIEAPRHHRHSLVLVPRDAPGVTIARHLPLFGYQDQHGHSEIQFRDVRVPQSALLGKVGEGFSIAQARLGPGRIHHAMRAIGMAERALSLMVQRVQSRTAFGTILSNYSNVQDLIAQSRIDIDQVRLYVYRTAWLIDKHGARGALGEIAGIKVAAPAVAVAVIDRAIEVFGAAGVSDDTPLAYFYAWARALRIVDGPDAVHRRTIAKIELKKGELLTGHHPVGSGAIGPVGL